MKLVTKTRTITFLLAVIISAGYFLARHVFDWSGIPWQTKYNIPGFLLLGGAYPWSWLALAYQIQLRPLLGHTASSVLTSFFVCAGFALNLTIVVSLIGKFIIMTSQYRRRKTN